ncbi:MAG: DUF1801 domain-containing protein [Acidimicrobiia bacterium]|nr:DUF1801 domain-containing protein [Acidimicrobiia bacterium]NNC75341.1 DUF1801 domain-containing protein [Acidimicrobiia bacterium]
METSQRDVDEFLASLPDEFRDDMTEADAVIAAEMDGLPRQLYEGKFWGGTDQQIIGYGTMVTTRSDKSEVEWFVVGLAAQKRHLSVYINAVEDRQYLSEKYGDTLGKVKVGKASIGFTSAADIDLAALGRLVAKARQITEA